MKFVSDFRGVVFDHAFLRREESQISERFAQLLAFLRERYGVYIDRLPPGDGFGEPSITDLAALRGNVDAFKERLREIGFFRDLSDAYVTQTVTPRYAISAPAGGSR